MSREFAHGTGYGDYSGVVIYGDGAEDGTDRLEVSARFFDPLFQAVLERACMRGEYGSAPRIAREWNEGTGWTDIGARITDVSSKDAEDLVAALEEVSAPDLMGVAGATVDECVRCARTIQQFIQRSLTRGVAIRIEAD